MVTPCTFKTSQHMSRERPHVNPFSLCIHPPNTSWENGGGVDLGRKTKEKMKKKRGITGKTIEANQGGYVRWGQICSAKKNAKKNARKKMQKNARPG